MDTPDVNRISAVSYCNFEDSPVFQYINGLSPIVVLGETVKSRQDVLVELKCNGRAEMANVSETKPFKEHVKLAIELATSLRNGEDSQMVSSDQVVVVPMDAENEVARVGVIKQSGELCRQLNELGADSDMVFQTEEMEDETGYGEQEIPNAKDSRITSFTSAPQQFSNNSGNVVQPYNVQVKAGASDTTLSRSSTVADIDSTANAETVKSRQDVLVELKCNGRAEMANVSGATANAEEKEEIGLQFSRKVVRCKQCRCKRSKCLKLHCDCFAAGRYCVEPCSCQDCFNRPIHEAAVRRSRRKCEARNPLAFAPKVVLTSASATYVGEKSNKIPASARHLRGCNCKKSRCVKKYCECYSMGVGCSASCRCIRCKNVPCQTNEQFHFPCPVESDAVTINEEAKDHSVYI